MRFCIRLQRIILIWFTRTKTWPELPRILLVVKQSEGLVTTGLPVTQPALRSEILQFFGDDSTVQRWFACMDLWQLSHAFRLSGWVLLCLIVRVFHCLIVVLAVPIGCCDWFSCLSFKKISCRCIRWWTTSVMASIHGNVFCAQSVLLEEPVSIATVEIIRRSLKCLRSQSYAMCEFIECLCQTMNVRGA